MGACDVRVISPTVVRGMPFGVVNRVSSVLAPPTESVSDVPVAWDSGPSDLVVDVVGTAYVPVHEATLRLPVRRFAR